MNETTIKPQDVSTHLREYSPKKRFPPRELYGEIRRRFFEKYGYWPSALFGADTDFLDQDEALDHWRKDSDFEVERCFQKCS